jgi:hypothetical protein
MSSTKTDKVKIEVIGYVKINGDWKTEGTFEVEKKDADRLTSLGAVKLIEQPKKEKSSDDESKK